MLGGMNDTQLLPDDLAACQAIIVEQSQKISEQSHTLVEQARRSRSCTTRSQEQELMINELLQRAYRNRSERYREDPNQLKLDFGDTPEAADAAEGLAEAVEEAEIVIAEHKRRRHKPRKPRNESLPAHLPRDEVTLEAPEEVKHCATARRAEADRLRPPGDAGLRAAQAQGARDEDSQVRLRRTRRSAA